MSTPTKRLSYLAYRTRARAALRQIVQLTHEQQTLMQHFWRATLPERRLIRHRLRELERDLARAHDERRRARASAPPAPQEYDALNPLAQHEYRHPNQHHPHEWQHKVRAIQAEFRAGQNKYGLAVKYALSPRQVRRILHDNNQSLRPYRSKLNEAQVREILRRHAADKGKRGLIRQLSEDFQVRKSTICDIVARRTWRDVDMAPESGSAEARLPASETEQR